jgi:ribonuclease Y
VIVQAADALSGARPGARGESLEQYVKRLRDLEQIATRHDGVDKVYAMQAGREIRVMVVPGTLDDDGAVLLSHEIEGPHALVGGDLARKHGESEAVAHAMEAHHNEVEPQTVEAVIVQAADALSGARPGARGESLEQYVKRLRDLEQIATRHDGVDKVYAMQAGREIRVMVAPGRIDDDTATLLSHEIAREIEKELEYPGQIKVTVIRESRAVEYAR